MTATSPTAARDRILARLAAANPRPAAERAPATAARLAHPTPGPTPALAITEGENRLRQFVAKLAAVSATVSHVSALSDLPGAVAQELRDRNLPAAIRTGAEPAFAGLDWGVLDVTRGPGRMVEPATLSVAIAGLAESGTLALASGPDNPVTLTFLGETHFVALRQTDLLAGFEDFWALWRAAGRDPRTLNLVTGPSRSADIGQVLQLGAHGPVALHVFLIG